MVMVERKVRAVAAALIQVQAQLEGGVGFFLERCKKREAIHHEPQHGRMHRELFRLQEAILVLHASALLN
jgi:hypothetical protein